MTKTMPAKLRYPWDAPPATGDVIEVAVRDENRVGFDLVGLDGRSG